jgi:hypothetical protein
MMKTYNNIFVACVFFMVSLSAAVMLWSQPLTGDLTRISAYPERWFGWNDAQLDITALVNNDRAAGKRHILVIGDSFSEAGHWQAFLGNKYTFSFIHNGKTTLAKILTRIKKDKPDAVIVETAERAFPDMYGTGSVFLTAVNECAQPEKLSVRPRSIETSMKKIAELPTFPAMKRETLPDAGNNISEGFHALKIWIKALISPKKRKAKTLALTQTGLFSNERSDQILLLSKDFLLYDSADESSVRSIRCSMQNTAATLAQTGIPYVILAIPDKTTAYQPYLADNEIRQRPALINRLNVDQIPHGIDMLSSIREMAAAGHKDIYLPDDTHWGYKGFQLAAALIDMEVDSQWQKNIGSGSASHD